MNVTQTVIYDAAGRVSTISAPNPNGGYFTNFSYSYADPTTGNDTALVQTITDNANLTTTTQTYDAADRLLHWAVTKNVGSTANPHDYQYQYDGNGNRTSINADGAVSQLSYNAANEWVQDVAGGKTDTILWDAAGNELQDNGFGGTSTPLQISYNAKNQIATETGCSTPGQTSGCGTVWTQTYTGPGMTEQVGQSSTAGTASFQYSGLGLAKQQDSVTNSAGASYVRDPYGNLVAMRIGDPTSYYYLADIDGSVVQIVGPNGQTVASYSYCPTGNLSDAATGQYANVNIHRKFALPTDWRYLTMQMGDIQVDTNSGNGRKVAPQPPPLLNVDPAAYGYLTALRGPDYYTYSTTVPLLKLGEGGATGSPVNFVVQTLVDAYRRVYMGYGTVISSPPFPTTASTSVTLGWVVQVPGPNENDLYNFITGRSVSLGPSGQPKGLPGTGVVTWGKVGQPTPSAFAVEFGAGTNYSNLSGAVMYIHNTWQIATIP